jgi:hypothetical protein
MEKGSKSSDRSGSSPKNPRGKWLKVLFIIYL